MHFKSKIASLDREKSKNYNDKYFMAFALKRKGLKFVEEKVISTCGLGHYVMLRSEDDARIEDWLQKKTDKYTAPDTQNELLKTQVLHYVVQSIHLAPFFTIMIWLMRQL